MSQNSKPEAPVDRETSPEVNYFVVEIDPHDLVTTSDPYATDGQPSDCCPECFEAKPCSCDKT